MIATVWPVPSWPEMPYAPLICAGVYPHGAYGRDPAPYGFANPAASFSPQQAEHRCALTNAAGGGASAWLGFGRTTFAASHTPRPPGLRLRPRATAPQR